MLCDKFRPLARKGRPFNVSAMLPRMAAQLKLSQWVLLQVRGIPCGKKSRLLNGLVRLVFARCYLLQPPEMRKGLTHLQARPHFCGEIVR
jgi:hypothetical protein